MKRVLITMAVLLSAGFAYAQQATVKEANAAAKSGNFSKAEQLINQALTNPETMNLAETWNTAGQIQQKKSAKQMENAVLKRPYDTMAVYNAAIQMVKYFLKCDELAQKPNEKGKINNKYRKANQQNILSERQNLANGGIYFYNMSQDNKANAEKALDFFGTYVEAKNSDMFADNPTMKNDTTTYILAYYACLAGSRAENTDAIIKYAPEAMKSGDVGAYSTYLLASAYKTKGNTDQFLKVIQNGLNRYPGNEMLFASMIDYYGSENKSAEALDYADQMIQKDPSNYFYHYVKGYLYQNANEYEKALECYKQSCQLNDKYAQAFSNAGICYRLMAQDFSEKATTNVNDPNYAKEQQQLKTYFQNALPYYEKARELAPDNRSLWMQGLYSIYYNLDMGDKFKEIEALMQ